MSRTKQRLLMVTNRKQVRFVEKMTCGLQEAKFFVVERMEKEG